MMKYKRIKTVVNVSLHEILGCGLEAFLDLLEKRAIIEVIPEEDERLNYILEDIGYQVDVRQTSLGKHLIPILVSADLINIDEIEDYYATQI